MRRIGLQCARMPALGDGADIPHHRLLGIEVGGPDEKQAPIVIALCEGCQHRLVQVAGDGFEQRGIVGHRVVEQCGGDATLQEHAAGVSSV